MKSPAERACEDTDLILRSLRSKRLEGWTRRMDSRPSFETRARALLRMRSEIYFTRPRKRAIVVRSELFAVTSLLPITAKLLRRGADGRTAGRPVQECDRCKRAKPRTDRCEGDIDPVFRVADHGVGREQIPYAAPRCRRDAPARYHGGGEHHIDRIGCGSRKQNAPGSQGIDGSHCNSFHAAAFSSKSLPRTRSGVGTGSRQENASKQKAGARF